MPSLPSSAPSTPVKSPNLKRKLPVQKKSIALAKKLKTEGSITVRPVKASNSGKIDDRFPAERHKITLWADEYMALGERTPSEFLAARQGQNTEILEESEESTLPYPSRPPSTPRKMDNPPQLVVVHKHVHTFQSSPHSKHTPQEVMQRAALAATHNAPGTLITIQEQAEEARQPALYPNEFRLADLDLVYTAADIPEVPTLSYTCKNFIQLPQD